MDAALRFPGITNAWTMPIKNRIDMLTTGIRTPIGIKVFGPDLDGDRAHRRAASRPSLRDVPGTRSVFAERVAGGYFLDFDLQARRARALRPLGRGRAGRRSCPPSAARTSPPPSRAARATP